MLEISVQFLSGEFVAQTHGIGSEWPPHPARLLYALIASWHDGGCAQAEVDTLKWLESQDPPSIVADEEAPEEAYRAWLPMNSVPNWNKKGSKPPSLPRTRQLRSSRFVGDDPVRFVWDVDAETKHENSLRDLCRRCTRLGSAESIVAVNVQRRVELHGPVWRPSVSGRMLRIPAPGVVNAVAQSESLTPGRVLPCDWRAYHWGSEGRPGRMITVGLVRGNWPVEQAPELAFQLRRAMIAVAESEHSPPRPILHGHEADGSPLRRSHLQFCPLPHVSFRRAVGAVLGVSFIVPPKTDDSDREYVERVVAKWFALGGRLTLAGRTLRFGPADSRRTLSDQRWSRPARVWQTVIPMELPRHASKRRFWRWDDWHRVAEEINRACSHIGLPIPNEVEASNTPFALGSPNARTVRGPHRRPVVHARLSFPHSVEGPLVIGAGRHFGYGLMEPVGLQA